MSTWSDINLDLLTEAWPNLEARLADGYQWVRIPAFPLAPGVWKAETVDVAFRVPANAGEAPYAFWVSPGVTLSGGGQINNYVYPSPTPWGDAWGQFSFAPDGAWQPKADVRSGVNMLDFVRGITARLGEGA